MPVGAEFLAGRVEEIVQNSTGYSNRYLFALLDCFKKKSLEKELCITKIN